MNVEQLAILAGFRNLSIDRTPQKPPTLPILDTSDLVPFDFSAFEPSKEVTVTLNPSIQTPVEQESPERKVYAPVLGATIGSGYAEYIEGVRIIEVHISVQRDETPHPSKTFGSDQGATGSRVYAKEVYKSASGTVGGQPNIMVECGDANVRVGITRSSDIVVQEGQRRRVLETIAAVVRMEEFAFNPAKVAQLKVAYEKYKKSQDPADLGEIFPSEGLNGQIDPLVRSIFTRATSNDVQIMCYGKDMSEELTRLRKIKEQVTKEVTLAHVVR